MLLLSFAAALEVVYQNPSTGYFVKTGISQVTYSWSGHADLLTFAFVTRNFPTSASDTSHVNQKAVRIVSLFPNNFVFNSSNGSISVETIYYVTSGLDAFKIFYQNPSTGYFVVDGSSAAVMDGNLLGLSFVQRQFPTSPTDVPPVEGAVKLVSSYAGVFNFGNDHLDTIWYTIPSSNQSNQSITVVSPNGGESWQKGSSQAITWTHPLSADTPGAQNLAWGIGLYRPSGAAGRLRRFQSPNRLTFGAFPSTFLTVRTIK